MTVRDFEVRVKPGRHGSDGPGWDTIVVHAGREVVRTWDGDRAAAEDFASFCRDKLADGYVPQQDIIGSDDIHWAPPARLAPKLTAYRDMPADGVEPFGLASHVKTAFSVRDADAAEAAAIEHHLRARGFRAY